MPNLTRSGVLTPKDGRIVVGRDKINLPHIPSMTLLTFSIVGGTASVDIEYSEDDVTFVKVATITQHATGVQFAIPAAILAINTTAITGTLIVYYRTLTLDNIPSNALLIFNSSASEVTNPVIIPSNFPGGFEIQGPDEHADPQTGKPVQLAGRDPSGNIRTLRTDENGVLQINSVTVDGEGEPSGTFAHDHSELAFGTRLEPVEFRVPGQVSVVPEDGDLYYNPGDQHPYIFQGE